MAEFVESATLRVVDQATPVLTKIAQSIGAVHSALNSLGAAAAGIKVPPIAVSVNTKAAMAEIKALETALKGLSSVRVSATADTSGIEKAARQAFAQTFTIKPTVDLAEAKAAIRSAMGDLRAAASQPIRPSVDASGGRKQIESLQKAIERASNTVLRPKVDVRAVGKEISDAVGAARKEIIATIRPRVDTAQVEKQLQNLRKSVESASGAVLRPKVDTSGVGKALRSALTEARSALATPIRPVIDTAYTQRQLARLKQDVERASTAVLRPKVDASAVGKEIRSALSAIRKEIKSSIRPVVDTASMDRSVRMVRSAVEKAGATKIRPGIDTKELRAAIASAMRGVRAEVGKPIPVGVDTKRIDASIERLRKHRDFYFGRPISPALDTKEMRAAMTDAHKRIRQEFIKPLRINIDLAAFDADINKAIQSVQRLVVAARQAGAAIGGAIGAASAAVAGGRGAASGGGKAPPPPPPVAIVGGAPSGRGRDSRYSYSLDPLRIMGASAMWGTAYGVHNALYRTITEGASQYEVAEQRLGFQNVPVFDRESIRMGARRIHGRASAVSVADAMSMVSEVMVSVGMNARSALLVTEEMTRLIQQQVLLGRNLDSVLEEAFRYIRAGEQAGLLTDERGIVTPDRVREYVDILMRGSALLGQEFTPELVQQMFKYLRISKFALSQEGILAAMLLNEELGSTASVGLNQMIKQLSGQGLPIVNLGRLAELGLINTEIVQQMSFAGRPITRIAGAGVQEGELLRQNPAEWVRKVMIPALKKSGVDVSDPTQVANAVQRLLSDRTAADALAALILRGDELANQIAASEKFVLELKKVQEEMRRTYRGQFAIIAGRFETLMTDMANAFKQILIPALDSLGRAIEALTDFITGPDGVPSLTKALLVAATGLWGFFRILRMIHGLFFPDGDGDGDGRGRRGRRRALLGLAGASVAGMIFGGQGDAATESGDGRTGGRGGRGLSATKAGVLGAVAGAALRGVARTPGALFRLIRNPMVLFGSLGALAVMESLAESENPWAQALLELQGGAVARLRDYWSALKGDPMASVMADISEMERLSRETGQPPDFRVVRDLERRAQEARERMANPDMFLRAARAVVKAYTDAFGEFLAAAAEDIAAAQNEWEQFRNRFLADPIATVGDYVTWDNMKSGLGWFGRMTFLGVGALVAPVIRGISDVLRGWIGQISDALGITALREIWRAHSEYTAMAAEELRIAVDGAKQQLLDETQAWMESQRDRISRATPPPLPVPPPPEVPIVSGVSTEMRLAQEEENARREMEALLGPLIDLLDRMEQAQSGGPQVFVPSIGSDSLMTVPPELVAPPMPKSPVITSRKAIVNFHRVPSAGRLSFGDLVGMAPSGSSEKLTWGSLSLPVSVEDVLSGRELVQAGREAAEILSESGEDFGERAASQMMPVADAFAAALRSAIPVATRAGMGDQLPQRPPDTGPMTPF